MRIVQGIRRGGECRPFRGLKERREWMAEKRKRRWTIPILLPQSRKGRSVSGRNCSLRSGPLALALLPVFDTTSPSAGACAIGISSIGRPSEPRLASPRHGTLTPGRISVGRPHCLIPISVGAVTGRKYHYPWRSHCDTACHRLFFGRMDPLSTLFGRR